jgi:hypothetical protein
MTFYTPAPNKKGSELNFRAFDFYIKRLKYYSLSNLTVK